MRFVSRSMLLSILLACGGDGASTEPVPTGPVVTTVVVFGPTGPMQIGATFAMSTEVRDQSGVAIAGKTPTWTSADTTIATVSSDGLLTAKGSGSTSVSATVEGKSGTATVSVATAPVFVVAITPLAGAVTAGESTALAAVLTDRNNNVLSGRVVRWTSSVPLVATVDPNTGRLSAASPGVTRITATSEGASGTLDVTVTAPAGSVAPTVTSIAPATLVPGQTATVTGAGFLGPGNTAVTVAGVAAAVLATTPTEVTIAVPVFGLPCQSEQPVPVVVATVGGQGNASHPLRVARQRPLAVGESFFTGATGDIRCNELSAGTYLVSVFNGNGSASSFTRFELRGSAGGAQAASVPAAPTIVLDGSPSRSVARTDAEEREQSHLDRLDGDLSILRQLGAPRRGGLAPSYSRAGTVPVPLSVVETTPVRFHYSSCTAAGTSTVMARVVYVGPRAVVLEDVNGPLARQLDADLVAMAQQFESVSYPLLLNFGDPLARDPATDANGRILMLFTPKVNALNGSVLGFVSACDLYPAAQDPAVAGSNEAEIFYARTVTDPDPASTTLSGRSEWRRQMPATMIHEGKHIASYAERLSRGAPLFEQVWLEEGTAQVASEFFGRAIHGNVWRGDATYRQTVYCESRPTTAGCADGVIALTNHVAFLTDYLQQIETKSMLSGAEDIDIYGSAWLFTRWLVDTYGGSDEGAFLRKLVQTGTLAGVNNVESATGRPFPELLAQFMLMLAADNLPNLAGPFVEPSWNLPDLFAGYAEIGSRPPAPLALRVVPDGAISVSGRNVKGGSGVLLRVGPVPAGQTQLLHLTSTLTSTLPTTSSVGLAVLRIE